MVAEVRCRRKEGTKRKRRKMRHIVVYTAGGWLWNIRTG